MRLAEAADVLRIRAEAPDDVHLALKRVLSHDGAALVDVLVQPNVLALPPKITIGQAEGFALAIAKEGLSHRLGDVVDAAVANIRLARP